ncbi:hypothetical protein EWB00_001848 [Schistosoma japonicum]|uniref:Uncharacterized protein n=1 Tax=Schistosoma japonicum TaxID=6182 RepID=A0A4Z2DDS0_SCHJA|nr:hypothetical protein EWB00_001848 [Schistosoma japonicum]
MNCWCGRLMTVLKKGNNTGGTIRLEMDHPTVMHKTSPIINAHLKYALFDGVGRTACLCRFSVISDGVRNRPCPPTDSQLDYSTCIHQNALSNGNRCVID